MDPDSDSRGGVVYLLLAGSAGLAITVGYRVAAAAMVSALFSVGVFLWDQQTYSSHRLLATALVAYLIVARSDAMWSVTSRQRGASASVPWWPAMLMLTQLSTCYFFAAMSKVNPEFLGGQPLQALGSVAVAAGCSR